MGGGEGGHAVNFIRSVAGAQEGGMQIREKRSRQKVKGRIRLPCWEKKILGAESDKPYRPRKPGPNESCRYENLHQKKI